MMSYESLHIFKPIKISIAYNFLTLWNFFLQFSIFLKMKQYQLFPVISVLEKQCISPLSSNRSIKVNEYFERRQLCHFHFCISSRCMSIFLWKDLNCAPLNFFSSLRIEHYCVWASFLEKPIYYAFKVVFP